jgi:DNA ligase-4
MPKDNFPLNTGKWFSYGDSRSELPDFVSSFSFATETPSMNGWKPKKEDYPDLWINPEDSAVVTLNAGEVVPSTAFPSRVTLRFPRITDIRYDKRAREVESLQTLWEIYDKVLVDRAGDNSESGFESQAAQLMETGKSPSRFWTEEKYIAEGKNRRKKARTRMVHSVAVVEDRNVRVESAAFKDVVFIPLEGTYRLKDDSLEAVEGQEGGWLEEAKSIRDLGDIRAFIKKHGGKVMLAPDAKLLQEGALVIGGQKDDPRVVNFIHLIETAQGKVVDLQRKKKRTAKDESMLTFAKSGGVVRWTFILSALYKWRTSNARDADVGMNFDRATIQQHNPSLLLPDALDYVARPMVSQHHKKEFLEELCHVRVEDNTKMRRLLSEVAQTSNEDDIENEDAKMSQSESYGNNETWREICKSSLDPRYRWIVRCEKQVLWPYQEDTNHLDEDFIWVYVDLFDNPFLSTNQLSSVDPYVHANVLSVLPLLRLAGAHVTTRLGARVTHVLCNLVCSNEEDSSSGKPAMILPFHKVKVDTCFPNQQRGEHLLRHIKGSSLYPDSLPYLISPEWVRQTVWNQSGGEL